MSGDAITTPRLIVRATDARLAKYGPYLRRVLPERAEFCMDTDRNAMSTFLAAIRMSSDTGAVHLEDDILICEGFDGLVSSAVRQHPDEFIQFFSRMSRDLRDGSGHRAGSTFSMNQCFYVPPGLGYDLVAYYKVWPRRFEAPTGYDWLMADFMASRGMQYWMHTPSLVDHRVGLSEIHPNRPRVRRALATVTLMMPTNAEDAYL